MTTLLHLPSLERSLVDACRNQNAAITEYLAASHVTLLDGATWADIARRGLATGMLQPANIVITGDCADELADWMEPILRWFPWDINTAPANPDAIPTGHCGLNCTGVALGIRPENRRFPERWAVAVCAVASDGGHEEFDREATRAHESLIEALLLANEDIKARWEGRA